MKSLIIGLGIITLLQSHEALSAGRTAAESVAAPLSAPTGLHAILHDHGATLKWQPVKGAEGYRIYRDQDKAVAPFSPSLESVTADHLTVEVNDLSGGAAYSFAVSAIRSFEESPLSQRIGIQLAESGKPLSEDAAP